MTPSIPPRPGAVTAAFALVWTQVGVGVISAVVFLHDRTTGNGDTVATLLVGQAISVGLPALLSFPLLRGRRWAQLALVGLAVLGVVARSVGLGDDPFIPLGLFQVASIACNLGIAATLLLRPSRRFFRATRGVPAGG